MTKRIPTYTLAAFLFLFLAVLTASAQLSVSTLAAVRHQSIDEGEDWGAGVDIGYDFNKYVTGHARAIGYSNNDWRGSVVDELSGLVEAKLLRSANNKLSLSALGGVDGDLVASDFGFSVGAKVSAKLIGGLSAVADSRIRAWFKQDKDIITTAGLSYSF